MVCIRANKFVSSAYKQILFHKFNLRIGRGCWRYFDLIFALGLNFA